MTFLGGDLGFIPIHKRHPPFSGAVCRRPLPLESDDGKLNLKAVSL